jgi:hypothetical protein
VSLSPRENWRSKFERAIPGPARARRFERGEDADEYDDYYSPTPTVAESPRQLRGAHEGLGRPGEHRIGEPDDDPGDIVITRVSYDDKPQKDLPDEDAPRRITNKELIALSKRKGRPFSALRGAMNVRTVTKTHEEHVRRIVENYQRLQAKEERAYWRVNVHPRRFLAKADPRKKDRALIEAVVHDKNERWRNAMFSGIEPSLIKEGIVTRPKLRTEKGRIKRQFSPVFYYG